MPITYSFVASTPLVYMFPYGLNSSGSVPSVIGEALAAIALDDSPREKLAAFPRRLMDVEDDD